MTTVEDYNCFQPAYTEHAICYRCGSHRIYRTQQQAIVCRACGTRWESSEFYHHTQTIYKQLVVAAEALLQRQGRQGFWAESWLDLKAVYLEHGLICFLLLPLRLSHEFGHYFMAKLLGVSVKFRFFEVAVHRPQPTWRKLLVLMTPGVIGQLAITLFIYLDSLLNPPQEPLVALFLLLYWGLLTAIWQLPCINDYVKVGHILKGRKSTYGPIN